MNTTNSKPELLSLTSFCKGLAIIAVVLVHWKGGWFGWQGVHVFIILSGLGLGFSCFKRPQTPKWNSWFRRRLRRLLPAYWLAVWISTIILLLFDLHSVKHTLVRTVLDTFLLTNVFEGFRGGATGAFWFVPFIIGAYLLFPALYYWLKKYPTWQGSLSLMLGILALEWTYRAIAIYLLDGKPIAHDTAFISLIPNSVSALKQQPDWLYGLFQRRAPFGFIPARMAEFTLGVVAGCTYARHPQPTQRIVLNRYSGLLGLVVWFCGQGLLYVGLWGWVFSDFVIAFGLILWMINLAVIVQQRYLQLFKILSTIGIWSYYIYLIHHPFTRLGPQLVNQISNSEAGLTSDILLTGAIFILMMLTVSVFSWLLMQFDGSKWPEWMINQLFDRVGNIYIQLSVTWTQLRSDSRLKNSPILAAMVMTFLIPKILLQAGFWVAKPTDPSEKTLSYSKAKPNQPASNPSSNSR
ncbi:MAG: acyltransferase family protein [Microcoleaceae cyanobacterium]